MEQKEETPAEKAIGTVAWILMGLIRPKFVIGVIKLWLKYDRKKSFDEIEKEESYSVIRAEGAAGILNIIAGAGAAVLIFFLFVSIGRLIWVGVTALFEM